ncbi:GNAT family N-acetyltransferase [Paenibacillus sp. GYB003]|uniref:GNAT family N-acetyltransferase n=1 Tax=Paenibacillus sp. GYB003 TaxID=2994392 RepID=UPI002F96C260
MKALAIKRMDELDDAGLEQAAGVFVDSYFDSLSYLSRDRDALVGLIRKSFIRAQFFAAVSEGRVVGITAYSTNRTRAIRFEKRDMMQIAGAVKGRLLHALFARELHAPLRLADGECYIEAVATDPNARGKGVATALLNQLLERLPYRVFTLEVTDTNERAIRLYEKQGFAVFRTKKQRLFRKRTGFNARLYMRKTVDKAL